MGHFVIQICQKSLRNWIFTLCNKIIIWILHLTLKIKTDYISTSTKLMVTTLGRINPLIMRSHEVTWLIKNDISPLPRGPWLARWRFIVKGHHPLNLLTLWSCDQIITWQMKNVISQLPRDLWLPKLTEWWVLTRAYLSIKSLNLLITWSQKVTWQMKNETCRYQTWQKDGLWLGVTCPTTKPHIPLITCLREFTWQINSVISLLPQGLLLLNLTGWWLLMRSHHSQSSVVLWS